MLEWFLRLFLFNTKTVYVFLLIYSPFPVSFFLFFLLFLLSVTPPQKKSPCIIRIDSCFMLISMPSEIFTLKLCFKFLLDFAMKYNSKIFFWFLTFCYTSCSNLLVRGNIVFRVSIQFNYLFSLKSLNTQGTHLK